jgi:hypothetical protein
MFLKFILICGASDTLIIGCYFRVMTSCERTERHLNKLNSSIAVLSSEQSLSLSRPKGSLNASGLGIGKAEIVQAVPVKTITTSESVTVTEVFNPKIAFLPKIFIFVVS